MRTASITNGDLGADVQRHVETTPFSKGPVPSIFSKQHSPLTAQIDYKLGFATTYRPVVGITKSNRYPRRFKFSTESLR